MVDFTKKGITAANSVGHNSEQNVYFYFTGRWLMLKTVEILGIFTAAAEAPFKHYVFKGMCLDNWLKKINS